jgi:hypothetical protein
MSLGSAASNASPTLQKNLPDLLLWKSAVAEDAARSKVPAVQWIAMLVPYTRNQNRPDSGARENW